MDWYKDWCEKAMSKETKQRVIENLSPFFPNQEIQVERDSIIPILELTLEDIARYAISVKSRRVILGIIPWFPKERFVASIYFQGGWFDIGCPDGELKQAITTAINRGY